MKKNTIITIIAALVLGSNGQTSSRSIEEDSYWLYERFSRIQNSHTKVRRALDNFKSDRQASPILEDLAPLIRDIDNLELMLPDIREVIAKGKFLQRSRGEAVPADVFQFSYDVNNSGFFCMDTHKEGYFGSRCVDLPNLEDDIRDLQLLLINRAIWHLYKNRLPIPQTLVNLRLHHQALIDPERVTELPPNVNRQLSQETTRQNRAPGGDNSPRRSAKPFGRGGSPMLPH